MRKSCLLGLMLALSTVPAFAQPTSSVWDGAFTDEQAARGAASYQGVCAMCHGAALEGGGEAPPLVGRFIPDWEGTSLADLYDKIHDTMPLFAPGTLSAGNTSDILAFVLKSNGFPAGGTPLAAGDALKSISFDAAKPVVKTRGKRAR